jgi:hypothetical protein
MFRCSIKSVQHSLHPNFCGQLGNTRMWPLTLRSIGRQLRDAPSDWRRSSFAFPGWRRFRILSCHSRPDRRGPIRSITPRPWLLRSSQHCDVKPCLTVGATTNSVVHIGSFSMFSIRYGMDLGPLCTPAVLCSRRVTLENPNLTACHFGLSLNQPLMAHS